MSRPPCELCEQPIKPGQPHRLCIIKGTGPAQFVHEDCLPCVPDPAGCPKHRDPGGVAWSECACYRLGVAQSPADPNGAAGDPVVAPVDVGLRRVRAGGAMKILLYVIEVDLVDGRCLRTHPLRAQIPEGMGITEALNSMLQKLTEAWVDGDALNLEVVQEHPGVCLVNTRHVIRVAVVPQDWQEPGTAVPPTE